MWDLIMLFGITYLLLYIQMDILLYYRAITSLEETSTSGNYGELKQYPEVDDFYCFTCKRHFSSYDHCYQHAKTRKHNKAPLYCEYSYANLPTCQRSSPYKTRVVDHV